MPRQARQYGDSQWYHVGNRGSRRLPIFGDDADREMFLSLIGELCRRFGVDTVSFCLMGNHYHLVLHCPKGNLSQAMHWFSTVYTQRFNRRYELCGPLFTGRFWSRPITTDSDLMGTVRYVEQNPKAIVSWSELESYPWSSLGAVLELRPRPPWFASEIILDYFGFDPGLYKQFMLEPPPAAMDPVAVRSELQEAPSATETQLRDIEEAVSAACAVPRDQLMVSRQGASSTPRLTLFLLCIERGLAPAEIACRYGLASAASVRSAIHRARRRIQEDPLLAAQVNAARALSTHTGSVP